MSHILKSTPKVHALFLPEALVDPEDVNVASIASDLKLTHNELMKQQKEGLKQAQKAISDREGENAIKALKAAEESLDITRQREAYVRYEAEKEARERSNVRERSGSGSHSHKPSSKPDDQGYYGAGDAGTGTSHTSGVKRDSHSAEGAHISRHDYSRNADDAGHGHSGNWHDAGRGNKPARAGGNKPGTQQGGGGTPRRPEHVYDTATPSTPPTKRYMSQPDQRNQAHGGDSSIPKQYSVDVDDHRDYPKPLHDELYQRRLKPLQEQGQDDHSLTPSVAAAAELDDDSSTDFGLAVGSLIQIPSHDPKNPLKYGTIKWIGFVQNVKGKIAGIELVMI